MLGNQQASQILSPGQLTEDAFRQPLSLNDGLTKIINSVSNQATRSINQMMEQISINQQGLEINDGSITSKKQNQGSDDIQINKPEPQINQQDQVAISNIPNQQPQRIAEVQTTLDSNSIEQINKKQQQLLKQLQALKKLKENILERQSFITDALITSKLEANEQEQQKSSKGNQESQQQEYIFKKQVKQVLSPVVPRRRYAKQQKEKATMPRKVVPEMSREQFQLKIKQIASHIRAKVQKEASFAATTFKSQDKQDKQRKLKQKQPFELPKIFTKSSNPLSGSRLTSTLQNKSLAEQYMQNYSDIRFKALQKQKKISQKVAKFAVEELIRIAFQKIKYKQKFGIKLDPVHHKYPMTSFRRKIIQEKLSKEKQRYFSQSLRQSILSQRKQIFEKSRHIK